MNGSKKPYVAGLEAAVALILLPRPPAPETTLLTDDVPAYAQQWLRLAFQLELRQSLTQAVDHLMGQAPLDEVKLRMNPEWEYCRG